MKGRKIFTTKEADVIRTLINRKLNADSDSQKGIRGQIRKIGFYWTDFYQKNERVYDVAGFDDLIRRGEITIID